MAGRVSSATSHQSAKDFLTQYVSIALPVDKIIARKLRCKLQRNQLRSNQGSGWVWCVLALLDNIQMILSPTYKLSNGFPSTCFYWTTLYITQGKKTSLYNKTISHLKWKIFCLILTSKIPLQCIGERKITLTGS